MAADYPGIAMWQAEAFFNDLPDEEQAIVMEEFKAVIETRMQEAGRSFDQLMQRMENDAENALLRMIQRDKEDPTMKGAGFYLGRRPEYKPSDEATRIEQVRYPNAITYDEAHQELLALGLPEEQLKKLEVTITPERLRMGDWPPYEDDEDGIKMVTEALILDDKLPDDMVMKPPQGTFHEFGPEERPIIRMVNRGKPPHISMNLEEARRMFGELVGHELEPQPLTADETPMYGDERIGVAITHDELERLLTDLESLATAGQVSLDDLKQQTGLWLQDNDPNLPVESAARIADLLATPLQIMTTKLPSEVIEALLNAPPEFPEAVKMVAVADGPQPMRIEEVDPEDLEELYGKPNNLSSEEWLRLYTNQWLDEEDKEDLTGRRLHLDTHSRRSLFTYHIERGNCYWEQRFSDSPDEQGEVFKPLPGQEQKFRGPQGLFNEGQIPKWWSRPYADLFAEDPLRRRMMMPERITRLDNIEGSDHPFYMMTGTNPYQSAGPDAPVDIQMEVQNQFNKYLERQMVISDRHKIALQNRARIKFLLIIINPAYMGEYAVIGFNDMPSLVLTPRGFSDSYDTLPLSIEGRDYTLFSPKGLEAGFVTDIADKFIRSKAEFPITKEEFSRRANHYDVVVTAMFKDSTTFEFVAGRIAKSDERINGVENPYYNPDLPNTDTNTHLLRPAQAAVNLLSEPVRQYLEEQRNSHNDPQEFRWVQVYDAVTDEYTDLPAQDIIGFQFVAVEVIAE